MTRSLALVAALLAAAAVRADPVEISVLTYNVHGLPAWIARDDPAARIPRLLDAAKRYDVVFLQEDFSYQSLVDADAPQPHRWRGNGAASPWIGVGSGVTLLSRLASAGAPLAEPYGVCNGWLRAANDCLGNKGFLRVPLRLPDGRELDAWDTHLDAGDADADRDARRQQLARLAAAIEQESRGRAVLVGGDFNSEWNTAADRALLDAFAARVGLAIVAHAPIDGPDEHIDYVLDRDGGGVCLTARDGGKDGSFVDAEGRPLSDHPAIRVRLRIDACP